jgi:hypothetical protein
MNGTARPTAPEKIFRAQRSLIKTLGEGALPGRYIFAPNGFKQERQMPSGWKIVDGPADGSISRVVVQRSDFRRVLTNGGGDALLASLQRRTSDPSGGYLA